MRKHPSIRRTARPHCLSAASRSYHIPLWGEFLESRVLLAADGIWLDPDVAAIWSETVTNRALDLSVRTRNWSAAAGFGDETPDTLFDDNGVVRWIVQLTEDASQQAGSPAAVASLLNEPSLAATIVRGLGAPGLVLVETECIPLATVRATLDANLHVEHFELDSAVRAEAAPNDPLFSQQFDLRNTGQNDATPGADIDAVEGWDVRHDASTAIVGVVDSGVDYTHPDLYLNIALLQGEIPPAVRAQLTDTDGDGRISFSDLNQAANASQVTDRNATGYIDAGDLLADPAWEDGIDNDGNGFKDDLIGWDFVNNDNDPFDDHRHGTHVAGTIAARGDNGVGVSGIAWTAQILPLKFLDRNNSGDTSGAVEAIHYAAAQRGRGIDVRVLNASWGSHTYSQSLRTAIGTAGQAGQLLVAASGNGDALGRAVNVDLRPFYPASLDLPNILSVAASDQHDQLASFSNYGATAIDLAAPGMAVLSTEPGAGYQQRNGTSMATPHVTGAAALIWANIPTASAAEVRAAILSTVDLIPALQGKVATGGRLNVSRALRSDPIRPQALSFSLPDITTAGATPYRFTVAFTDNVAVEPASFGDFNLLISRSGTTTLSANAHFVASDSSAPGSPRVATYEFVPPGGSFDPTDNGDYQIVLRSDQVRDAAGNSVEPQSLTRFRVAVPEPLPEDIFTVNDFGDSVDANPGDGRNEDSTGKRTLRASILEANAKAGTNTISLGAGVFLLTIAGEDENAAATGDFDVTDSLTIKGQGIDHTIIDAAQLDRVFDVWPGVSLILTQLTIRRGNGTGNGGAIVNRGTLILNEVVVAESMATQSGGAIANSGSMTISDSTVSDNSANGGGGLFNDVTGTATVERSTFVGNAVTASGGAILNEGLLSLVNVTLSTNSADIGGGLSTVGSATLTNVTFANNSATTSAGGVASSVTDTALRNTLIALNTAPTGADVTGSFTSAGHNLVGVADGVTSFISTGDHTGTAATPLNPRIAPLAYYGGHTATHALLANSTAIDSGDNTSASATDQRGAERQLDGPDGDYTSTIDIGAFEFGTFFATSTVDDVDASPGDGLAADSQGQATLRAAIQEANATPGANVVRLLAATYTLTRAGRDEEASATGDLDVLDSLTLRGASLDASVIDANSVDRAVDSRQGRLTLESLTMTKGLSNEDGGGVRSLTELEISDARVSDNRISGQHFGAGIFAIGRLSMTASIVEDNQGYDGGGLFVGQSFILNRIQDSTICRNVASNYGGAQPVVRDASTVKGWQ